MFVRQDGWHYIHVDGACAHNGDSYNSMGIGIMIEDSKGAGLFEAGMWMGSGSSNMAEYIAVAVALLKSEELGLTKLRIFSDSEIVVKQFSGDFMVRAPNLIPLHQKLKELANRFEVVKLHHISRESNYSCDRLAKKGSRGKNQQWLEWFREKMCEVK